MNKKTYFFQSEIKQLLNLMINSLYSNKEIFLRELISNSCDALDKLKFYYLNFNNLSNDIEYCIKISIDDNILTISDNGIGMTKDEVISNLGTIAKSGTKEFLKNFGSKLGNSESNIIGQFGVGFYSSFMVSNKVLVHTRSVKSKENNSILWESDGQGEYIISNKNKSFIGTDVILYIKDECKEYLNKDVIINIIKKYSNYVSFPIKYKILDKGRDFVWKKINVSDALWTKSKNSISDKEYIEFYKSLVSNLGSPLIWSHNKVEGKNEYVSLLYIPDTAPWNIWNRDEYKNGVKLYIRKVFIMEGISKIIPFYLRFVQGIIDSNYLSLNVSREILQENNFINKLHLSITKIVLKMLIKLSKDIIKYNIFWKSFGNIFKEGLAEDESNRYYISLLLRFSTTFYDNKNEYTSLEDYLNRMSIGQDKIYYIISDNYLSCINSPHLEVYKKKKIEVLLMYEKIDEWMMVYLNDFKGIKLVSVNKNDFNDNKIISLNKSNLYSLNKDCFSNLIKRIKFVLGDLIKDVKLTDKLDSYPVVVTTSSGEMSTQMLKLLTSVGKKVPKIKYLLEINCNHMLIKYINNIIDDNLFKKWIYYLYYQALLIEMNTLENPVEFINLSNELISKFLIK